MDDHFNFQHLTPRTLPNRENILSITHDIEYSMTGRFDVMSLHNFFVEASSLLRNAVRQYEEGFFDASFYSVRTALELIRIITHFSEQDNPTESDIYQQWRQGGWFPHDSKIRNRLKEAGAVYSEVRNALSPFFDKQDERLEKVQKYIHKQSYKTFYSQNPFRPEVVQSRNKMIDELFVDFITNSIAEIAILRLCVDPFPLLLKDDDVMYKIHFQSMTIPFSDEMLEIIGSENVSKYQTTDFYQSHKTNYLGNEDLSEATHNLINNEYYDRNAKDDIYQQISFISKDDKVAIMLFDVSEDITKVFLNSGLSWYFSSTKSARKDFGFKGDYIHHLTTAELQTNVPMEEAYISFFLSGQSRCWIEHNDKLSEKKIEKTTEILEESDKNKGY